MSPHLFKYSRGYSDLELFLYLITKTVSVILGLVSLAMLARMILSIFVKAESNTLYALSCIITEPFVAPVRAILALLNIGQNSPIDWAFFLTYLILSVLRSSFPVI